MKIRDMLLTKLLLAGLCALLLLLSACSSQPGRNYTETGLQETLETDILTDTSKMFTYRLRMPEGAIPSHVRVAEGSRRTAPPGAGIEINRNTGRRLLENASHVTGTLGFCREGFLTLDHSISRYHLWLKGECREGATAEDIERFGRKNTLQMPSGSVK